MIEKLLEKRFITLFLIPLFIGSLSVLSFQPFNYILINFFVLPFCFYLIIFIKKKSKSIYRKKPFKKNLFLFGTSFGFGFYFSGIHWITNSLTFDESFTYLIPFALILIPLFLSLFFSLAFLILGPFINLNFRSIFLFSGVLSFFDYLRAKLLTGFPWNIWAYSYSWNLEIIQILNKLGLFAFNIISITFFMMPIIFFLKINKNKKFIYLILAIIIAFSFYIYGNYLLNENKKTIPLNNNKIHVKVISPNFELEYNLNKKEIKKRLVKLIRYSDPVKDLKTIFVWPEGVFSGYSFKEILIFKEHFSKSFNKNHYVIFGINRYDEEKKGFYNSLIVVNNDLKIIGEYRKQKLVPFGEFLPLEKLFNYIGLKKITEGHGSFLKANPQKNLRIENLNILPLICYEIIFTELIQKSHQGTNLIINISEDGWFGDSIGPYQHFAKSIFRAIEQDTFLVRSTNKGISAIINNKGKVIKKLEPNEAGNIELEVPLIKSKYRNKNDLIFFALLITYIFIFNLYKKDNER